MTGTEFAQFIQDMGWTEVQAAKVFGVGRATIQRYKLYQKVPGPVELAAKTLKTLPKAKLRQLSSCYL